MSGPEFGLAVGEARRIAARALTALAPYDAVLTPTLAQPPLRWGRSATTRTRPVTSRARRPSPPGRRPWNLTGMPAVSLPLHRTAEGLPVGVMLAARPAQEALLLSLAAQVEEAAPWKDAHPSCW